MKITEVPFGKYVGIAEENEMTLKLEPTKDIENHLQTIHASAQYTLAETQSALYLERLFPKYVGQVIPLLRSACVKYKNSTTHTIVANANVEEESKEKFISQFEKKGRASITVIVEIIDSDDLLTMQGEFTWFIQTYKGI